MSIEWKVVSPLGGTPDLEITPLAPRLNTLDGKTVCQVWNGGFRGEVTFPLIAEMLKEKFTDIKVIPYTELPLSTVEVMKPSSKLAALEAIRAALVEKGCDALITGNGG